MTDVIHKTPRHSVYDRTDYLVNSDMTIPFGLANAWNYFTADELGKRLGLPQNDRRPHNSQLVLRRPKLPEKR